MTAVTATALAAELRAAGIRLVVEGDRLVARGRRLPPDLADRLREHKAELVALLTPSERPQYPQNSAGPVATGNIADSADDFGCRDAVLDRLRPEREDLIAVALEVFGARLVYRTPPGLRCGRCGGEDWRPCPRVRGEVICVRCWSPEGTLRPLEEVVPPAACPACGGPAWRVCGAWYCERCEPPVPAKREPEPGPSPDEREAVHRLAATAGFPGTPLSRAISVLPGEGAWRRFVATARTEKLAAARAALGDIPTPGRGA